MRLFLDSYADNPSGSLSYIAPLLEFAKEHIPSEQFKETPLYILATAGMRLIPKEKQEAIVQYLRNGINKNYSFLFPEGNLEIISGKQVRKKERTKTTKIVCIL